MNFAFTLINFLLTKGSLKSIININKFIISCAEIMIFEIGLDMILKS